MKFKWLLLTYSALTVAHAATETPLPAMTVTASKTEKTLAEAPATVRVISSENITNRRVTRFGDAMREQPSWFAIGSAFGDQAAGTGRSDISIRGIRGSNRALFMLDGQPLNNAQSGAVNLSTIMMDDVQQIDYIAGPFSSLYGSYALSGVVNALSKTPEKREFTLRIGGGGAGNDSAGDQWNASGIYRDKFANGLGISIGVNYNQSFGYANSFLNKTFSPASSLGTSTLVTGAIPTTDAFNTPAYQLGQISPSPFQEGNAFAKLYYDFSPKTHGMVGFSIYRSEVSADEPYRSYLQNSKGQPINSGNLAISNGRSFDKLTLRETEFTTTPSDEEIKRYFARFNHQFDNKALLKADFSVQDRFINTGLFSTTDPSTNFNGGAGELSALPKDQRIAGKLELSMPLHFAALPDWLATHNLVTGFDANEENMHRVRYNLSNWRDWNTKTATIYNASGTSNTYGGYIQDEWQPVEQLSVFLGGRVDSWSSSGKVQQMTPLLPYNQQYPERTFTQFSPKGAVVYKPLANLVLKGSAGLSFRPPTTFDLYTSSVANSNRFGVLSRVTTEAAPNLQPEQAFSWEIGAQTQFDTGTDLSATYYKTELTDLFYVKDIITGTANDLKQTSNAGKAKIRGVEATLKQTLIDDVWLFSNVSYTHTKITENDSDPTTIGKQLTRAPKLMWNVGIEGQYQGVFGSIIGRYVDKSYADAANRDVAVGVQGAWDAYYLLDTKIGYEVLKGVKTSFAVQNLLDEHYYQSTLMSGRTFIGEVSLNF
jgi:iron complex outermembrane receptor protein